MDVRTIKIRAATLEDSSAVAGLCAQLGYNAKPQDIESRLLKIFGKDEQAVFVAERESVVTGWIQVSLRISVESGVYAEIAGLVVDESFRGKGIGEDLVREAEEWARKVNCTSIRVRTNVLRARTHDFYRKLGFEDRKKQTVFEKRLH